MIEVLRLSGLAFAIALVSGIHDSQYYSPTRTLDPSSNASPPQYSAIDSLIASGEQHYWEGQFDAAESTWYEALRLTRDTRDRRSEARILTWLGLAAYRTGNYEAARRLGEEALALKLELGPGSELAKSYNALGLLAWNEGSLVAAAHLFDQAREAARRENDQEIAAKAANNLGLVYSDLGEFIRARESFKQSLSAGRRLGDEVIEGRTLSNLGMLEIRTGDPAVGMKFLSNARLLYRTSGDVAGEINTLGQLATAYADLGEPRRAFAALDSSLGLARQHDLRSEEASSLELLAALYQEAGDLQRALDLCEQARRLNHELGLQIEEGNDLLLAAGIYARLGDLARARSMGREAADLHHATGSTMEELYDLLLLAELDHLLGRPTSSRQHLSEARTLAHRLDAHAPRQALAMTEARIADQTADSRRVIQILADAMPDLSEANYQVLWEAEALRARAYARLGDLDAAAAAGFRAVAAVERVRERFGSILLRTAFIADRRAAFTDLIDVLLEQGRVNEAFEIADAARGRTLVERLVAAREIAAGGTVEMFADGERVLREIDELVLRRDEIEALPPEERGDAAAHLGSKLRQARARYEEVLVRVQESSSEAVAHLGGGPAIRSIDVQQSLGRDEMLLEYVVTSDRVILLTATREDVKGYSTPIAAHDLNRRLRVGYELSSSAEASATSSRVLEDLYSILLGPLEALQGAAPLHLIIVPDAALGHVPFAALRDPHSGRYIVERHTLSYLPTASALPILRRDRSRERHSEFGTYDVTVLAPLPEILPATREEARGIRRSVRRARIVEGPAATEERLRRELATNRIVHVASHGALESSNPLFSRIELFRASDHPSNDGRLEVHEVLGLGIRSPLVFLSGCETEASSTGLGSITAGDDYATLARAFLYSGARTVIATLWRIDDKGAALFAGRYYEYLKEVPPNEALARTQRDFIRSRGYSEPYFWASYRLAGEGVRRL